jgi:hypothetical protein
VRRAFVPWAIAKAAGLASGIILGAVLAIAIVERGPHVWVDLTNGDAGWWVAAEWSIALRTACFLALIGSIFWMAIAWRKLTSYVSAGALGFLLSALAALLFFGDNPDSTAVAKIAVCASFGLAGLLAGLVTFYTPLV